MTEEEWKSITIVDPGGILVQAFGPLDEAPGGSTQDKKYDTGKPMVALMKRDFAKALIAVAEVTTYGVEKYNQPGSWRLVKDAWRRYEDALGRHDLEMNREDYDKESGLLHAAHRAWNALATLELQLNSMSNRREDE